MDEKNKFHSSFTSSQFVPYIEKNELDDLVKSLAHTLSEKYKGQEVVMIGVLKGSMTFLADLVREMRNVKIYVDFVKLQAIGRG